MISPVSLPWPSTMGSFSILCRRSRPSAASAETPACAVISGALVITSETGLDWSTSKRMSRLVMMPDERAGRVHARAARRSGTARTWRRPRPGCCSGEQVTGSVTMPASDRFTVSTWPACSADGQVAVQHAHAAGTGHRDGHPRLGDGVHRRTDQRHPQPDPLVSWLDVSTLAGTTSDAAGSSRTSSKVESEHRDLGRIVTAGGNRDGERDAAFSDRHGWSLH